MAPTSVAAWTASVAWCASKPCPSPPAGTFLFFNRRRTQVKLLYFEGDGFGLYHKRLDVGTYELPEATGITTVYWRLFLGSYYFLSEEIFKMAGGMKLELLPLTGGKKIGRINESIKFDYMSKRVFDSAFKKMAVELSYSRGSVKEAPTELGIDPGRITKWRHQQQGSGEKTLTALTEEQKEIRRLQKALKEAQLERDILKSIYSAGAVK